MEFEASYTYRVDLAKKAYYCYLRRHAGYFIGAVLGVLLGSYLMFSGDRGFGGFCLGVFLFWLYGWWDGLRRTASITKSLEGQEVRLSVNDEGLKFESSFRSTRLMWKGVSAL